MSMQVVLAQVLTAVAPPLADVVAPPSCHAEKSDADVVVCARRVPFENYRIKLETTPAPVRAKAAFELSDRVGAAAETEAADVGGRPSNRVMVRLKIKF